MPNVLVAAPPGIGKTETQIASLGSERKYELILHVANFGQKVIKARVWRLQ